MNIHVRNMQTSTDLLNHKILNYKYFITDATDLVIIYNQEVAANINII